MFFLNKGQAIVLITILVGSLFIVGTYIAGILMQLNLRNVSDIVSSNIALFAADAGIEKAVDCFLSLEAKGNICNNFNYCNSGLTLSNGATSTYNLELICENNVPVEIVVTSIGKAANVERVLERKFNLR